jgi:hypothetical protein
MGAEYVAMPEATLAQSASVLDAEVIKVGKLRYFRFRRA